MHMVATRSSAAGTTTAAWKAQLLLLLVAVATKTVYHRLFCYAFLHRRLCRHQSHTLMQGNIVEEFKASITAIAKTKTILMMSQSTTTDSYDPSMAKRQQTMSATTTATESRSQGETVPSEGVKKENQVKNQVGYVPTGLSLEEYNHIKREEQERLDKMEFGIWGPKFDRMDGPLIDGMTWMFTPKLWTGEVESVVDNDGEAYCCDDGDEQHQLGDSVKPSTAWEYATDCILETNEYGDTIEHPHEWEDTFLQFYHQHLSVEDIALNRIDFTTVGVEEGQEQLIIEKMNVVQQILQSIVHGRINAEIFPFHILARETKSGTPTAEDWEIMKRTESKLGIDVTSAPDILKLKTKTSDQDLISGMVTKSHFLQSIYAVSKGQDNISNLTDTNVIADQMKHDCTGQEMAEMNLCMSWYLALRRLGINDPFGNENGGIDTSNMETATPTANAEKPNIIKTNNVFNVQEPEPEPMVVDNNKVMIEITPGFLSNAVVPWKYATTALSKNEGGEKNDWRVTYERFHKNYENAKGIAMTMVDFNTVDINEASKLMTIRTCEIIRQLLRALLIHGKILEANGEGIDELKRLSDPDNIIDCLPPNKAEWIAMQQTELELNLDVSLLPDTDVASTAAVGSRDTSKDDDLQAKSRICGIIPRLAFLQKTLENIKGASKTLEDFSEKTKAKMELKLEWYLTLRRCGINNPYPK